MTTSIPVLAPTEQTEGSRLQVLRWLKSVGADVVENEPLIEIETDKVTVEVPSPATGVLREILRHENDEVTAGELLAQIEVGVAAADAMTTASAAPPRVGAQVADGTAASASSSTQAFGTAASHRRRSQRVPRNRALRCDDCCRSMGSMRPVSRGAAGKGASRSTTCCVTCRHSQQDPPRRPSGQSPPSQTRPPGITARSADAGVEQPGVRRVPHSGTRKRIAERMVESLLHTAPHVTSVFDVDLGAVLDHRSRHRAEFEARGVQLTLTAYFLQACVAAIREVPETNARWTDDALEVFETIDIGVGTAVEGKGLVVPIIRDVQNLELFAIAQTLGELVARARADKLTAGDVRGGTFTISNHGVSGSVLATPIVINQPQSAILGIGKLEKRPVVVERDGKDELVIRSRCYVTLTIDHRVMDGHRANRFLTVLKQQLEAGQY
jgi:2-oxoglutarate dehydrogenase E2 component (dihydrolipoamide succinyltransferase)